jgi:acetate kinase
LHLLVINSGSSSIKFSIFAATGNQSLLSLYEGEVTGIGSGHASFRFRGADQNQPSSPVKAQTSAEALGQVVAAVTQPGIPRIDAVGYRVVHPGAKLDHHTRITNEVLHQLDEAVVFAPLHDPSAIAIIRDTMARFPDVPHFACFDTIFHHTMPETASTYAIPLEYRSQGVRRYGFHGLSCESIVTGMHEASVYLPHRMVIAHLGSGCSITALLNGHSVDTTMGLTPTGGVVMGTRPGDLDPGLVLYLLRQMKGGRADALNSVERLLNFSSGIAALSGLPNDMRSIRQAAVEGNTSAQLAIDIFTRSVRKAIGSFAYLLGGLDAIVFTGGIGEHDTKSRAEIVAGLEPLGISLDVKLNDAEKTGRQAELWRISASESRTEIFLIPAKEDWMIARHMHRMLGES